MNSSIIDSIKSLPPLSKTIMDINRVYADEEAGIGDLAKVIEGDPMIVANLLKAANSPLYSFGKEIKNVSQAVSLFGMSMTRSIAQSTTGNDVMHMGVILYITAPCVQYSYHSDGTADEPGILGQFLQCRSR